MDPNDNWVERQAWRLGALAIIVYLGQFILMQNALKLYLVHCGFYDSDISDGLYESHTNYFVTGTDFDDARAKVKLKPEYLKKKMHVDGIQEIQVVEGQRILLKADEPFLNQDVIINVKHRDLAPKTITP